MSVLVTKCGTMYESTLRKRFLRMLSWAESCRSIIEREASPGLPGGVVTFTIWSLWLFKSSSMLKDRPDAKHLVTVFNDIKRKIFTECFQINFKLFLMVTGDYYYRDVWIPKVKKSSIFLLINLFWSPSLRNHTFPTDVAVLWSIFWRKEDVKWFFFCFENAPSCLEGGGISTHTD